MVGKLQGRAEGNRAALVVRSARDVRPRAVVYRIIVRIKLVVVDLIGACPDVRRDSYCVPGVVKELFGVVIACKVV